MLYGIGFTFIFFINFHGARALESYHYKLHMFQDLIGLEGDELAQFIPSAGEKYAFFFQMCVCVCVFYLFLSFSSPFRLFLYAAPENTLFPLFAGIFQLFDVGWISYMEQSN